MAAKNLLPIFRRCVIRDDRQNVMVHFRFDDKSTGNPIDLSAYTLTGSVALVKGASPVASMTFINDLGNGIIKAILTEVDSAKVVTAAIAGNRGNVFWDIKVTPAGGEAEQWFEGAAQVSQVVTQ